MNFFDQPPTLKIANPPPRPVAPENEAPTPRRLPLPLRSGHARGIVRAVLFVVVLGSLGLIYWSFVVRYQPVTRENQEKTIQMSRLADEIEQLRFKWPREAKETKTRFKALQESLIADSEELREWQEEVRRQADMAVLEADVESDQPQAYSGKTENLNVMTTRVNIRPLTVFGSTNSPYKRLLAFAEGIEQTSRRFDLLDLSVDGNSNSVSQAKAVLQVFSTASKSP